MTAMCACGKPLHYNDLSVKGLVDKLVELHGDNIVVNCNGTKYSVQRHYIALHGIQGIKLETLADQGIVQRVV